MSIAALSLRPTLLSRPVTRLKFANPTCFHGFSISEPSFPSRHISVWGAKPMTELVRTSSPLRSSDGIEGFEVLETEEAILVEGPTELSADFASGGLESTLNRLSKWLVAILFGTYVLVRHDAEALWAVMGSIINTFLSVALKHILKQERPVSRLANLKSDPGMPSSHAQSIFFVALFGILSLVKLFGVNEATLIIGLLALAFSIYLSWLRVSQQLHTTSQVVLGAIVGSFFSILWFKSWDVFVLKAFMSYLWVRIFVVLGAAGSCLGFLIYVIQHWLDDEL